MRLKSAGKGVRHPLWSKETFLADFRKVREVRRVCETYATLSDEGKSNWGALRNDVWRWRKADRSYDEEIKRILAGEGTLRDNAGRPALDEGDDSWKERYCSALVENRWSLAKAAIVTPYTMRAIKDKLDPVCSSYDPEFKKMVDEAESIFASKVREGLVEMIGDDAWKDFDTAKISQSKAWFFLKMQERLEEDRFGRRRVEISGNISHTHSHRHLLPEEKFALLIEDRKKFMERRSEDVRKALPPGEPADIIDVPVLEVIKDEA